jgi:hypothetical protein
MKISFRTKNRFTSLLLMVVLAVSVLLAAGNTFPVQAQDQDDKTPLTFHNLTRVSPNRQYIVSVSADNLKMAGSAIWLGEPYEPDSTILVSGDNLEGGYWVTNPIWSPDSDEVAYLKVFDVSVEKTANAPQFELWAIGIDGKNNRLLTGNIKLNPSLGHGGQAYLEWTSLDEIEFLDSKALPIKKYALRTETLEIREVGELSATEIEAAASAFNKISPTNGATIVSSNIPFYFLNWGSAGDTQYEYCVDLTNNNDCDGGNWITRTATYVTSQDMTFLEGGKTYYWQVRTTTSPRIYANGGTWWNFKFDQGQPGAFSKIEPINAVIKTALPVTLKWGASSAVATYEYCVDLIPCTPSISAGTATSVSWSPSPEPAGGITTYYWQVKALNSSGTTFADGGAMGSFIIDIKPGAFAKTAPATGTQTSMTPTLSWGVSAQATSYEYCISETQSCDSGWTNVGNANSKTLSTPLDASKTYYWQVRGKYSNVTTEANSGTWWSFITVPPPSAFGKTSPTDSATDQSLSPTFEWETSSGVTGYEYCYSSVAGPCSQWHSVGTNTSVTLSGLAADYTYYWQVRAVNVGGATEADASAWWSFTTTPAPSCTFAPYTPPSTPSFVDVPEAHWAWDWIERFYSAELTTGCAWVPGGYCPGDLVTREQMAVFIMRAKNCGNYTPAPVTVPVYSDVPGSHWAAGFIRDFRDEKITTGCAWVPGGYCPGDLVTREQMAVFLIRATHGGTYSPPAVTAPVFTDVPASHWAATFIKQFHDEGITTGCAWVPGGYCPGDLVTREQMAVFIGRAFKLP